MSKSSTSLSSVFIPVYEYAKENQTHEQNVYRWIREGKIAPEDIQIVKKTVERISIRKTAKAKTRKVTQTEG